MSSNGACLIVEDDHTVREMVADSIFGRALGYDVRQAARRTAKRDVMALHRPDVVLLDVRLPGEDGLTLARYCVKRYDAGIYRSRAAAR